MVKRTFKYCGTHIADEAYMQKMCSQGWAAIKLVEGFWTFEECEPNQYCYRMCYLRGQDKKTIAKIKKQFAVQGIEFVSQYAFWAIFRSKEYFEIYQGKEELDICKKIYAAMPAATIISTILFVVTIIFSYRINVLFLILSLIVGIYGIVCAYLTIAYNKLIKELSNHQFN